MLNKTEKKSADRLRLALFILMDILLINVSMILALQLRFDMSIPSYHITHFWHTVPILTICTLSGFFLVHLYDNVWEYASIDTLLQIALGTLIGCGGTYLFSLVAYTISPDPNYFLMPRTVYFLNWILLMMFIGVSRLGLRVIQRWNNQGSLGLQKKEYTRVMIIGGGWAGAGLIREIQAGRYGKSKAVVVVDDNPSKKGKRIYSVPVVLDTDQVEKYAKQYNIDEIIIAIATPTGQLKPLIEKCLATNCRIRMVTALQEVEGKLPAVDSIRDVNIEDLLGRTQQKLDMAETHQYFYEKVVLITGGGGSIGGELCKQILAFLPKKIILYDISENYMYDLYFELQEIYGSMVKNTVELCVGNVQDPKRLDAVFEKYRPQIVIHAAAHKHVPLMETAPDQAIQNNVFGTYHTATTAIKYDVERFILISTDKAVNPTNVMGATKRCAEMIIESLQGEGKTEFAAVRFGNVLVSHGSVVPLFEKQIKAGGPVTITHPDIIRYFMTIPEAASLVLQAATIAKGGEVFVLDMGEPMKIKELAERMIQLYSSGDKPPVEIKYIGLRPGEKLYEELLCDEEKVTKTQKEKIFIAKPEKFAMGEIENMLESFQACLKQKGNMKEVLKKAVPSFVEPNQLNCRASGTTLPNEGKQSST